MGDLTETLVHVPGPDTFYLTSLTRLGFIGKILVTCKVSKVVNTDGDSQTVGEGRGVILNRKMVESKSRKKIKVLLVL